MQAPPPQLALPVGHWHRPFEQTFMSPLHCVLAVHSTQLLRATSQYGRLVVQVVSSMHATHVYWSEQTLRAGSEQLGLPRHCTQKPCAVSQ